MKRTIFTSTDYIQRNKRVSQNMLQRCKILKQYADQREQRINGTLLCLKLHWKSISWTKFKMEEVANISMGVSQTKIRKNVSHLCVNTPVWYRL